MKKNKISAPASAASSSSTSNNAASRRGQKTLGWFLSEELIEKTATSNTNASPSPPVQARHTASGATVSSTTMAAGGVSAEEKKRRRGGRGHRQRKLTESLSTASEASLPMLEGDEKDQLPAAPASDFYVYDVASDGYYYEQNGAKGWRRRLPQGVQPKKPTTLAAAAAVQQMQQNEELHRQAEAAAAAAAAVQRNHMNALQAAMAQQPTAYNRYYDAPSDGYYFEMASVDGWRKRTAAPSAGAPAAFGRVPGAPGAARGSTPTNAFYGAGGAAAGFAQYASALHQQQQAAAAMAALMPSQSYGAALARGELPAKCMIESSASSSVSDDLSYPSLSRPTSLDLNNMGAFGGAAGARAGTSQQQRLQEAAAAAAMEQPALFYQWNADKFIEELCGQYSGSGLDAFTESFGGMAGLGLGGAMGDAATGADLKTPATSMWHRRFSATTTSSTSGALTGGEEEDQEEYALTKELENIWKTPTPVQN